MDVHEWFSGYPAEVEALCHDLRDLVREEAPGAREEVKVGWQLVGYTLDRYFCGVYGKKDRAGILFERGGSLIDAHGLLVRDDRRQTRVVELRPGDSLPEEGLRDLLRQAIAEQAR